MSTHIDSSLVAEHCRALTRFKDEQLRRKTLSTKKELMRGNHHLIIIFEQ